MFPHIKKSPRREGEDDYLASYFLWKLLFLLPCIENLLDSLGIFHVKDIADKPYAAVIRLIF